MGARGGMRRLSLILGLALAAWAQPAPAANLLSNGDFEWGNTTGWVCWGGNLSIVSGSAAQATVHGGRFCVLSSGRTATWQGPVHSILGVVQDARAYRFSAWVRLGNAASDRANITIAQTDVAGVAYHGAGSATVYRDRWVIVSGVFTPSLKNAPTALDMYIEGPQPGVSFYVDDVCVEEMGDWQVVVRERTEQNRKREVSLTVLSASGQPVVGAHVQVRQIRHQFAFGSAINSNVLKVDRLNAYPTFFRDHFEWAVLENESKWYYNEPIPGYVTYEDADRICDWCQANNITVRGHCIFWESDAAIQDWVKSLAASQLRAALQSRMNGTVTHFQGRFVHWDVNNEMLAGSFFQDALGESIRVWMFQRAHEIDPAARLFINEYGVIDGGYNLDKCLDLARGLLDRGVPVDCIGTQCHFDSGFDRGAVLDRFDRLATLGLPIWCTEFDVADPDDHVRADELEAFYRIAFSHPNVEGILMWGFWEKSQWRENCHIVNADWSLNEAGRRYEALLKEWTTETEGVTSSKGLVSFRGFHGTYKVTIGPPYPTVTGSFTVTPGPSTAKYTMRLP
jgi:endo-1,4-beta-xylanase